MKKFIKKHLAVILSFAIVLTTLLPVLTGLGSVAALSAEEQMVVDNLKAAWEQMTSKPTTVLYPNYTFPNGSKTLLKDDIHTTADEANLPFGATADMLGKYYVTGHNYTVTNKVQKVDSTQRILFYGNDSASKVNIDVTGYTGFYFYVYFEDISEDISINPVFVDDGGNTNGKVYTVPASKKGQWIKITDTDLFNGGIAAITKKSKLYGLQLNLSAASGSANVEAVVGSLQFTKKAPTPADSETADWTLIDWIKAALKVNVAEYSNTDAFVTALAAANTSFGEEYAIANLIKEWEALSVYHDPDINPNRWWKPTPNGAESTDMKDSSTYTGTLPAGVDLGANYATLTDLGDAAGMGSKQCVLYEFFKGGTGVSSGGKSVKKINEFGDIYFWFKADNATKDVTLTIRVMTNDSSPAKTNDLPSYVIPASKSGQWVKVSLKEIGGSEWYGNLTERLYRVMVAISNANGATVTAGSGKIVVPNAYPVPANVADTADAWIKAASELDTSNCVDDSAFKAAVSALGAYATAPNAAVEALKIEWEKLEYVGTSIDEGFKVGIWQNGGTTYKEGDTGATQLVYDTNVDTTYGEYQFTANNVSTSTISDAHGSAYFRINKNDAKSETLFADLNDITFWYKASGNAKARIGLMGGNATLGNLKFTKNINDVSLVSDGTWKLYSVKELIGDSVWQETVTAGAEMYLQRLQINLATFDEGVDTINVSFGALNYTLKDTSLNGYDGWSNEQWVDKALALDLTKYKNTTAFETAMYAALESVYGMTKADLAAQELIAAWGEITGEPTTVLYPNHLYPDTNGKVLLKDDIHTTADEANLPFGATADMLGDYYVTNHNYTVTYAYTGANSSQRILFFGNDKATPVNKDVSSFGGFYFYIYFEELTQDINITSQFIDGGGNTTGKVYTVSASNKGQWIKITDTDLFEDGIAGITNKSKLNGLQLHLSVASGSANVEAVVGSLQFEENISAPAGAEEMTPEELLKVAMEFNLSQYSNTEKFAEKLEALKLLCEETVAIDGLKKATNGLSQSSSDYLYPRRYYDAAGNLCSADKYALNVSDYTGALPEGADSENYKSYLGNKLGVIPGLTNTAAEYKTNENKQTVLYEFTGGGKSTFTAGQIIDMYFWYKLEGAASAKIINGIYITNEQGKNIPTKLGEEITLIGDGNWHKLSFSEVYGKNWVNNHKLYDGKVYRAIMSIGGAEGGTITLGSIVTESSVGLLPDGSDDWTLSDWIYAVSKIDYTKYIGAEDFKEALDYAIQVRNSLKIIRSTNITNYNKGTDADVDASALGGKNIFETLVPTIYHSTDGQTKEKVDSETSILLTDGDITTVGSVTGLDNSNEASFTDFIYQFAGEAKISDLFVYNDDANIAGKYDVYIGNSESSLFYHENLLVPFVNEESKSVQRFNFDGKPEVAGNYLAIRVYGDTDTVSFAEFKAYGEVVTYEVEKGNFDNDKIASIGDNILKGKTVKIKAGLKFDWENFISSGYKKENLTDADTNTPVAVYGKYAIEEKDDTISIHFYYDLGTTYTIDKLFINHWKDKGLETGKYEIYGSKDINSLFMSRNMILSYDNTKDGPNGGATVSQLFTLKNKIIARYISFHITYPISDWEYASTNPNYKSLGVRLSEFGVYGKEWKKEHALVNLTSHVSMDVYRTDAKGVTQEVGDSEYDGVEHKNTYDGKETTFADISIKNGEKLDFVYNLAAEMTLEEICMKLMSGTVKRMNIYASTVEDAIWDSSSLVYSENQGLGKTYFGKGFAASPIKARYIRFEILENEGEDLRISEMSAIGGNDQEFTYMNLVEENPNSATFLVQEKSTGKFTPSTSHGNKWIGSWVTWDDLYPIQNAFDNDNDTVYDMFGGKNGEKSVNILLDLGTLNAIDDITLVGGSSKEYWPDEMNYYFGEDSVDLFDKDAKPAKKWLASTEDGMFTYEFVPQVAQYVRIEFLRAENEVYSQYLDHIGVVIGEILVNGLELKSRVVNGIVATFEDKETGIKAEILALRDNDVYDTIQGMTVVKKKPTEEELDSAKEQGLKVDTDIYEIYFTDANGDIVTDTEGREIIIYIPQTLSSVTEDIFVLLGEYGGLSMIEFESADGYYYFTIDDISSAINVALGYTAYEDEFDDSDFEDSDDEFEEEEDDDNSRKKIKVIRKPKGDNGYLWIILVIAAGVAVIAAAVVIIIVLKKKKDKENEE